MTFVTEVNVANYVFTRVVNGIALLIQCVILFLIVRKKLKNMNNAKAEDHGFWWIAFTIVASILFCSLQFIPAGGLSPGGDCSGYLMMIIPVFYAARYLQWNYCLQWLTNNLDNSLLKYSTRTTWLFRLFFLAGFVIINVTIFTWVRGNVFEIEDSPLHHCVTKEASFGIPIMVVTTVICNFVCFIIFAYKAKKLTVQLSNVDSIADIEKQDVRTGNHPDIELLYNVRKASTLTGIAMISTLISFLLIYATHLQVAFGPVDIVINTFCMLLFSKEYNEWFKKLCCCFLSNGLIAKYYNDTVLKEEQVHEEQEEEHNSAELDTVNPEPTTLSAEHDGTEIDDITAKP